MKDENNRFGFGKRLDEYLDAYVEIKHRQSYKSMITYDEIFEYAREEKLKNPQIELFVVSVKKNYDPQNENDKLIVIQGFLDGNRKVVSKDGKDAESKIFHTKSIDKKFIEILDGAETKIIKI